MTYGDIANIVSRIPRGQSITVDRITLRDSDPYPLIHNGFQWKPEERVMENIIGSSYNFLMWENPETGDVTFEHLEKESKERTYQSPDRRGKRG